MSGGTHYLVLDTIQYIFCICLSLRLRLREKMAEGLYY